MMQGRPRMLPCTPHGVLQILYHSGIQTAGQHVVVVGRSDIVGKPLAIMLAQRTSPLGPDYANATVTICHSRTPDLARHTSQADILVAAVGQPQFVYYNSNADYLNHLGHTLKSSDDTFKTEGQSASLRPSFVYGVMRADGFYVEGHTPLGAFPRLLSGVASKLGEKKESGAE